MKTALELSHYEVAPGRQGHVDIDVTNNVDVIDGVTAIVDGINPDWIQLEQPVLSLFPEATGRLRLVFDIPTTCPAGDDLVVGTLGRSAWILDDLTPVREAMRIAPASPLRLVVPHEEQRTCHGARESRVRMNFRDMAHLRQIQQQAREIVNAVI